MKKRVLKCQSLAALCKSKDAWWLLMLLVFYQRWGKRWWVVFRCFQWGSTTLICLALQSVAALQRCALAMALFPGSFGLEGTTANRVLVSWYTATQLSDGPEIWVYLCLSIIHMNIT